MGAQIESSPNYESQSSDEAAEAFRNNIITDVTNDLDENGGISMIQLGYQVSENFDLEQYPPGTLHYGSTNRLESDLVVVGNMGGKKVEIIVIPSDLDKKKFSFLVYINNKASLLNRPAAKNSDDILDTIYGTLSKYQ